MRVLTNPKRVVRLMHSVINDLEIDLTGISVLTEAASGPFAVTPVLAAMAGAQHVVAVGRSSRWGTFSDVIEHIQSLAKLANCEGAIEFSDRPAVHYAQRMNLITNLGFVRPIDAAMVAALPNDSVVSLMWDPWEFRSDDVDLHACRSREVPVLGTNEEHPRLRIFDYLPRITERLLLERDIEVERSHILLVASSPFGPPIEIGLRQSGAEVIRVDPTHKSDWVSEAVQLITDLDAVVVAEHDSAATIVGSGGIAVSILVEHGVELIHICGTIDESELASSELTKHPARLVSHGVMTVTTDYVGPRPVIDLHAAGLAVGASLIRLLREGKDEATARAMVVASGLGADFPESL